ncbi:hypothetical protein B0A67_14450 [Flavobacterium aquidurense]|jgi:hypothetical protein|nr:hypothetical protein B0A67_14450 [Flavobacterium aquidurense]SHF98729.1 hypothetical protein SAMN05444481_101363 [Flavobacterium frigidimaris]
MSPQSCPLDGGVITQEMSQRKSPIFGEFRVRSLVPRNGKIGEITVVVASFLAMRNRDKKKTAYFTDSLFQTKKTKS